MRPTAALLLLLVGCAPAAVPPATTPPPLPTRPENVAAATGVVHDSSGRPVPHARIRAWAADPSCRQEGDGVQVWSNERFEVTVERGVGPQERGCLIVEAAAGGSVVTRTFPATFASGGGGDRVVADLVLPAPPALTRAEADRLMDLVRRGINTRERAAIEELAMYTREGVQELYAHLGETQRHLRTVVDMRLVSDSGGGFVYELSGHRSPPVQVTVSQDALTRVTF